MHNLIIRLYIKIKQKSNQFQIVWSQLISIYIFNVTQFYDIIIDFCDIEYIDMITCNVSISNKYIFNIRVSKYRTKLKDDIVSSIHT